MPGSVVGSVVSGVIGGKASSKAANAQQASADQALGLQKEMFDISREDLAPYRKTGELANSRLSYLMGLSPRYDRDAIAQSLGIGRTAGAPAAASTSASNAGEPVTIVGRGQAGQEVVSYLLSDGREVPAIKSMPKMAVGEVYWGPGAAVAAPQPTVAPGYSSSDEAAIDAEITRRQTELGGDPEYGSLARSFRISDYIADPGYKFRLDEGNKALAAKQSASGNMFSGKALKAASAYNSNMASQEYGSAYERWNRDKSTLYSRLGGIADAGRGATNTAVGLNQNNASAGGSIYAAMGQNQANAAINQGNIMSQGLSGILGGGQSSYGLFNNRGQSGLPWQTAGNVNPNGGFYY